MPATPLKVFVSYSHDSLDHEDRVLALADRLRTDGIDAQIDQYELAPAEGWTRWMRNQMKDADFVLVICTETYQRRAEGREEPGKGRGGNREGLVIDQEIYESDGKNRKFIAVTLRDVDRPFIPDFLRPYQNESVENEKGYVKLYRRLTNQPEVAKPELGKLHSLSPRERKSLASQVNASFGVVNEWSELGTQPTDCVAHLTFYNRAMRGGRRYRVGLEKALQQYDEAIRLDPNNAVTFCLRGMTRELRDEVEGALRDYDEAIRLNPRDASAFHCRGHARATKDNIEGALRDYDEAIRLNPASANTFYFRAIARERYGPSRDVKGAVRDYDEAIRLDPTDQVSITARAWARKDAGDLEGSRRDYDEAIRHDPTDSNLFSRRAGVRRAMGDLDGALQDYSEAIRLRPDNPFALTFRGIVRKDKGDLEGALDDCLQAQIFTPNDQLTLELEAEIKRKMTFRNITAFLKKLVS